jgi:hypothetical protein
MMKLEYFADPGIETLKKQLSVFESDDSIEGIIILACDSNNYDAEKLDPILNSMIKPIFGGIFPAVIFNNRKYETGFILACCETTPVVNVIENISSPDIDFDDEMMKISKQYSETKTLFVFIDGFAERINSFIEGIFTIFGLQYNYIGGGAGSLSLVQKPCIFTNQGLKKDCAVLAGISLESGIGVKHGWKTISGPYKVTASEKTIIKELDFKPAFDIYKQAVENHSGKIFTKDNFFEIAKGYPFGINKIDTEKVVRDPLLVGENNSLVCVGEVETGSFVNILTGRNETLIEAAGQAMQLALKNKSGDPEKFIFFADCISRVLFLEDDFNKELEEVISNYNKVPLFGALTIGEIANNGKEYLEFYNKTSVIGCF